MNLRMRSDSRDGALAQALARGRVQRGEQILDLSLRVGLHGREAAAAEGDVQGVAPDVLVIAALDAHVSKVALQRVASIGTWPMPQRDNLLRLPHLVRHIQSMPDDGAVELDDGNADAVILKGDARPCAVRDPCGAAVQPNPLLSVVDAARQPSILFDEECERHPSFCDVVAADDGLGPHERLHAQTCEAGKRIIPHRYFQLVVTSLKVHVARVAGDAAQHVGMVGEVGKVQGTAARVLLHA